MEDETERAGRPEVAATPPGVSSEAIDLTRIDRFLTDQSFATPFIVIDLDIVRARYRALQQVLPAATIFYAVKANPAPEIIRALADLGASFDIASEGEMRRCRGIGISAGRLSFGNTIKREAAIAEAHADGVGLYAVDSLAEVEKVSRAAPGAGVFCRILADGKGAEWPLSRKFGCVPDMAVDLLHRAKALGLRPLGVSFHVGSQQTQPAQWGPAIAHAAHVFEGCDRRGIHLDLLNLGGGLPAHYRTPVPSLAQYGDVIRDALARSFGGAVPRLYIEPGRYLVGDSGVLRSTVLLVSWKSPSSHRRWIYLDAGRFNGLPETMDERIHYPIRTPHDGMSDDSAILAGPTCDSTDVIYQHSGFRLPRGLAIGDPVDFLSAGAYTASYAAVDFNGFPPIRTYCL